VAKQCALPPPADASWMGHIDGATSWGTPRAIAGYSYGFWPHNLCAFAWRATGDISAEVFSMSKHSAWRSLLETAMPLQGQATR